MPRVHVIGAGIAGLASALRLAGRGRRVVLYEAAAQAGGRCRSYFDAKLGRDIDNGNHILLSANEAALSYLEEIGARQSMIGPARARFPFIDLASGQRWTLAPNAGPLPWWILDPRRRIPDTRLLSYLAGLKLAFAGPDDRVIDRLDPDDPLWRRFWEPLCVAALNTSPREASARLLWLVLKETFARGEAGCRPLVAREGLGASFIDPALRRLRDRGAEVHFNHRLRSVGFAGERAQGLDFGDLQVELDRDDWVVAALPPASAAALLPGLAAPRDSRPIVNAHIRLDSPAAPAPGMSAEVPFLGLVGGSTDWLFLRGDVISLTVSAAEGLAEQSNEAVAAALWADTARALDLPHEPRPVIRVIKEKRATFAQTPATVRQRPPARTAWRNLALAGDWTDTGYPATIESAVRSGRAAARLIGAG
jgi:squalene-associated FAD-dependent desaturase